MKKELTLTFLLDSDWYDDEKNELIHDDEEHLLRYAKTIINEVLDMFSFELYKAEYDGNLLYGGGDKELPEQD